MKNILVSFLLLGLMSCKAQPSITKLSVKEFNSQTDAGKQTLILDVRTPEEYKSGYIRGAVNIDYRADDFEKQVAKLDKSKTYLVYCLSGGRSGEAATYMREQGFKQVQELKGGVLAWEKAGFELEKNMNGAQQAALNGLDMPAFEKLAKQDKTVLIDFYAPWCGPCRKMEPALQKVSQTYKGKATIVRINIDENRALARQLGVDEIPYLMLYKDGEKKGNFIGAMDEAGLVSILEKATSTANH
jgi:thioredoxin 1